jgi:hypothetical protein
MGARSLVGVGDAERTSTADKTGRSFVGREKEENN